MSPNTAFTLNSANPKFYEQKFLKKKLPAIQTATTKPTKPGVSFKIGFEPDSAMPDSITTSRGMASQGMMGGAWVALYNCSEATAALVARNIERLMLGATCWKVFQWLYF